MRRSVVPTFQASDRACRIVATNVDKAAIRRAQSDADFVAFHALLGEYEQDLPPKLRHGVVASVNAVQRTYAGRDAAFLATLDGNVIGCVAVASLDGEAAILMRLFVTPQSRGLGAARTLVTAAIDFVREAGYARVVLDTEKALLPAAYELYRSMGFAECAPYAAVEYDNPTFMELHLR